MKKYEDAFNAFLAGCTAAFATGYAEASAGNRSHQQWMFELAMVDYENSPNYEPADMYQNDDGEWVPLPGSDADAGRRADSGRTSRREAAAYTADFAAGASRFRRSAGDRGKSRFLTTGNPPLGLDLLSAFAAAYAAGQYPLDAGRREEAFADVFLDENLYDAFGIDAETKGTFLSAYKALRHASRLASDQEATYDAEEKVATAAEFGLLAPGLPAGRDASRTYHAGYIAGRAKAYETLEQLVYDAVVAASGGETDMAKQVIGTAFKPVHPFTNNQFTNTDIDDLPF